MNEQVKFMHNYDVPTEASFAMKRILI
jgi:hypothetical protein